MGLWIHSSLRLRILVPVFTARSYYRAFAKILFALTAHFKGCRALFVAGDILRFRSADCHPLAITEKGSEHLNSGPQPPRNRRAVSVKGSPSPRDGTASE